MLEASSAFPSGAPMIVLIVLVLAAFGLFVGYAFAFGRRTRHTKLHKERQTPRDLRDRQEVGSRETRASDEEQDLDLDR